MPADGVMFSSQAATPPNFIGTNFGHSLESFLCLSHLINDVDALSVLLHFLRRRLHASRIRRPRVLAERCRYRPFQHQGRALGQNSEAFPLKPWLQNPEGENSSASLTVVHTRMEVFSEENQSSLKIPTVCRWQRAPTHRQPSCGQDRRRSAIIGSTSSSMLSTFVSERLKIAV